MPWYQVPVRQASDLPLTSFRPNVTVGTLSLAVRLPLLGRARALHPLDYAHVGRTKKGPAQTDRSFLLYQRVYLLLYGCLRGGEAGDGHTEGRAAGVVHANLGAELNT